MNRDDRPGMGPASEPECEDRLDDRVVSIPCYEPAGLQVDLTGRALVTHTNGVKISVF